MGLGPIEKAFTPIDDVEVLVVDDLSIRSIIQFEQGLEFFVYKGFDHFVEGQAAVDVADAEVVRATVRDREEVAVFVDDEFAEEV